MPVFIGRTAGHPTLDALPVALVKHYPLEPKDYKPYAQGRFCFAGDAFVTRLLAFEVKPNPKSQLRLALCPTQNNPLVLDAFAEGTHTATVGGVPVSIPVLAHFFTGEDLQGIYWGVDFTLSKEFWQATYPNFIPDIGRGIQGNLYKLCTQEREHYGSLFKTDFTKENPYETYGDFEIMTCL